ncbi:MAG: PAS domain-containing sensor histidine kinase, partial [Anaerolineae bacterium]|nr:PAS domain-containing sensor histidine kinase [Anaerolineae bacterium]
CQNFVVVLVRVLAKRNEFMNSMPQNDIMLHKAVSSIGDYIYVMELNPAGEQKLHALWGNVSRITGYSIEQFLDAPLFWQTIVHPDDKSVYNQHVTQLADQHNSEVEYRLNRADGQTVWVRDCGRVEADTDDKQRIMVYGVVSDITSRRKAQESLVVARDRALEASRLKSQLLANVSHDLRTPLTTILGYAQLLEMGAHGPLADKQRETISGIIKSSKYLTDLVNDLLDQAKLEDGKLKLNIVSFVPSDIVNQVQSNMSVPAHTKGLTLITDIGPDVPLTVTGDPDRVQQILANLVSNAIKFTPEGTVHVRLFRPDLKHWALQVSDTGIGIPLGEQSYIFEPFRQVDGAGKADTGGAGLGLSIVKQLTMLMGGHISLKSEEDKGSTFTIHLPLMPTKGNGG